MKAVLLVGGEGTRLRPLTYQTVKAMVPIVNRPFLEYVIRYLQSHGVDEIVITLCYLPDKIQDYFGDGANFGVRLEYVQEKAPLGTAGAVKNAATHLEGTFVVLNGDIFTELDLSEMIAIHRAKGAEATIALTPVENPTAFGVVEIDQDGLVNRFVEKPPPDQITSNLINAGVYVLEPAVLDQIPGGVSCMFERHVFPGLLQRNAVFCGYTSHDYWLDIGTPEKYLKLNCDLLQGNCSAAGEKIGQVLTRTGAAAHLSESGAVVEGPVVVGRSCVVHPQASLRGPLVMGDNCTVSKGAIVERAVIWNDVSVGTDAVLQGCVVGASTRVGNGCRIGEGCVLGGGLSLPPGKCLQPGEKVGPEGAA